jgi:hypothetical protein
MDMLLLDRMKMSMKKTKAVFGIISISLAIVGQVQAQSFLTNGLVAYYPFNGNANDESGNGNDGTLAGTDWNFALDRFGEINSSLYLNTTSTPSPVLTGAYVAAPRSASLDFNADFSLSVWIHLKSGTPPTPAQNFISNGSDFTSVNLRILSEWAGLGGQDGLQVLWNISGQQIATIYAWLAPPRDVW